ncbi:MAG TPA: branched-chain amino acid ABC transporter permease [Candidatus Dormibacteraeota bacterium]|nr:branched-chain amino acid ABC transporter permease [Candidatus Dormibacteraeota bacterium]
MSDGAIATAARPLPRVRRWTATSGAFTGGAGVVAVGLALVPLLFDPDTTQKLTTLLVLVILAATWNALAGYGGLVSVGQQAFIGIGAYATVFLAGLGVPPYVAMALAALGAGALAVPISLFALRLRAAQFAIGMWVIAEVLRILVTLDSGLGGGTGTSLIQLNQYAPAYQQAFTYWSALGFALLVVAALFLLLRSRMGLSLQAIRDDEEAAASLGVRVLASKRVLFVLAAAGGGAAGAVIVANTHFIEPGSIFSVQWTAYMIFMVLVGGLGTFEGPLLGALLLFAIQTVFSAGGAWYLVGLGAAAAAFALLLPGGIWGFVERRLGLRLLPVGYRVTRE